MGWSHAPIAFTDAQRERLRSAWPKKAAASAEEMLSYMAGGIADVLYPLREDGELEPPLSARKRAAQWRAVAEAAAALETALGAVSDTAMDDAFDHDLGTVPAPAVADAYSAVRRERSRWRREAFTLATRAERWAEWSAGKPDHGVGDHRPRDAAAWEVGRRAALTWARWSGRKLALGFTMNRKGETVGSPCMRFIEAVLAVANDVERAAATTVNREPRAMVQGSGISRAIVEEVRALPRPALAELAKLCGIPSAE